MFRPTIPLFLTGKVVLQVSRTAPGERVSGRYVPGSTSTVEVEASVQPYGRLTGEKAAAEGDRHRAAVKVFARQALKAVVEGDPSSTADTFEWEGDTYEVIQVMPWKMQRMDHYECVAVKKERT